MPCLFSARGGHGGAPPPPPFPLDCGSTTESANAVAPAASTALPPWRRMAAPASLARGCPVATAPRGDTAAVARTSATRTCMGRALYATPAQRGGRFARAGPRVSDSRGPGSVTPRRASSALAPGKAALGAPLRRADGSGGPGEREEHLPPADPPSHGEQPRPCRHHR